ncbi:atherin-like [Thrips palmi]|uniref:Atherin-like n=1 Tax=Thrips palmi TaxID=161013 RepID=A0A6P8Y3Y8_THRPL|nr:atherin-like [Thrips palmi]
MRPRLQWWAEEAEWLAARLDRWLAACQGLGHGLGQGYSKLHSSDKADRPDRPGRPPRTRSAPDAAAVPRSNPLKACAQRLQSIGRTARPVVAGTATLAVAPAAQCAAKACSRPRRRQTPQPPNTPNAAPTAIVFEKCRPRTGRSTSPSMPAVDIVYYPFRVENCVVCRQLGAAPASTATSLAAVPCPQEGCCAPYVPSPQERASGASGALLFRDHVDQPQDDALPPPPPRPNCGEREPVISMSQDYIEVRYQPPPTPPMEEQPPPSYQAAMRRAAVFDRQGDSVIGDLALFSPRFARAPTPRYSAYVYGLEDDEDDAEDTIYSRNDVPAVLEREMAAWQAPRPRPQHASSARYRSRSKFSSVMYETQRMFEEAFHVSAEEVPVAVQLPSRGRQVGPRPCGQGAGMTRAWSLHDPHRGPSAASTAGLREVDMPHGGLGPGLRSLLSIRRRPGGGAGAATGRPCGGAAGAQASASGASTSRGRQQKKVVVGERGLRGPVWPRVILTFDRGVTPYQPYQAR